MAGRVSIARYQPPKFGSAPEYKALAPGEWFNKVKREEYERRFAAMLRALDAATIWRDLHELTGEAEPILLCWETKNWQGCHRRIVARWSESELGEIVSELEVQS
jgi:hypothetical protein